MSSLPALLAQLVGLMVPITLPYWRLLPFLCFLANAAGLEGFVLSSLQFG